ncbi:MAG: hypothetical protein IJN39_01840 [Clostridia bacterium]|nr:hypothetical protein [Clostridia bacterium]
MFEMLCAIPSPTGGEDIVKKYIMQKYPECKEDALGNLVLKKGEGGKKIMLFASLDEDAAVAMDVEGDKVNFAHLGSKKVYPGQAVSFGGYTGVVCSDDENPEKNQYIKLIDCKEGIEQGRCGVFEGESEGDLSDENGTYLAKNAANRAVISAMLKEFSSENEVYLVFGVQSNHRDKGLVSAIETINPDEVILFEETDSEKFEIKLFGKGYSASAKVSGKAEETFEKCGIEFEKTADAKKETKGAVLPAGISCVVGIPVKFSQFVRQGIAVKTITDLEKFVKCYLEEF